MQNDQTPPQDDNPEQGLGRGMLYAGWIGALVVLTYFFSFAGGNKQSNVVSANGSPEVHLERRNNHYIAEGTIDRQPVMFLVDTGATDVSVPAKLADKLGLQRGIRGRAITANGTVNVYASRIDHLQIGDLQLRDVRASINPGMEGNSVLLGMSALKHLDFFQRDGVLVLKYKE